MKFFEENSQKVISLGGIIFSIAIIYFAFTYDITKETDNKTMKQVSEKTESQTEADVAK